MDLGPPLLCPVLTLLSAWSWGEGAVVAIYTTGRKLFQQVKTDMAVPVLRECQLRPEEKCEDEFLECQQGF